MDTQVAACLRPSCPCKADMQKIVDVDIFGDSVRAMEQPQLCKSNMERYFHKNLTLFGDSVMPMEKAKPCRAYMESNILLRGVDVLVVL